MTLLKTVLKKVPPFWIRGYLFLNICTHSVHNVYGRGNQSFNKSKMRVCFMDGFCYFCQQFFHETSHMASEWHYPKCAHTKIIIRYGTEWGQGLEPSSYLHNFRILRAHWSIRHRDFHKNQIKWSMQKGLWQISRVSNCIFSNNVKKSF